MWSESAVWRDISAGYAWLYARNIQPVVHCNGDAAIDDYLFAIAKAQEKYPQSDLRPVAVHCQNVYGCTI